MTKVHEVIEFREKLGMDLKTFICYLENIDKTFGGEVSVKFDLSGEIKDKSLIMFQTTKPNNICSFKTEFNGILTVLDDDGFIYEVDAYNTIEKGRKPDFTDTSNSSPHTRYQCIYNISALMPDIELVIDYYTRPDTVYHMKNNNSSIPYPIYIEKVSLDFYCEGDSDDNNDDYLNNKLDKPYLVEDWNPHKIVDVLNSKTAGYNTEILTKLLSNIDFDDMFDSEKCLFYEKIHH